MLTWAYMPYFYAALLMVLPLPAQAYIDPGSASLVLQALAGAVASALLFWRNIVNKGKQMLARVRKKK